MALIFYPQYTYVRVRLHIRMCEATRPLPLADTYARERRQVRTCMKRRTTTRFGFHCSALGISLQCIKNGLKRVAPDPERKRKSFPGRTAIPFGKDSSFLREGLEFSSDRTDVFPEGHFRFIQKRLSKTARKSITTSLPIRKSSHACGCFHMND